MAFLNRCIFTPTAGGVADFTVQAALPGYMSPVQAGAVNGANYHYVAETPDKQTWEIGLGTWNSGVLARTTVLWSSAGGTKISFQGIPTVSIDAIAEDLPASTVVTNNSVIGNVSGSTGAPVGLGPAAFMQYLSSNNNLASPLYLFNANTIISPLLPSSPAYQFKFGPPLAQFITDSNRSAIVGQSVQNQNPSIAAAIQPAVIGYGVIVAAGAGNQVQGMFARAEAQAAGGATGIEIDAWNTSSQDAPDIYPATDSYGTTSVWTFGAKIAPAGTKINWAGIHLVQEPTFPGNSKFRVGIYATPAVCQHYGGFFDADGSNAPLVSWLIRNNMNGINAILQSMGTYTKAAPVLQTQDASGNVVLQARQDGGLLATISPLSASTDSLTWAISNTNGGSGASANFTATSAAGTLTLAAAGVASAGILRWSGAGTFFIDALNAAGVIQLRTDATPHSGAVIDSKQNFAMGDVAANNSALATTATDGFLYIRSCAGAPTGVPTSFSGRDPLIYDTTNNKLWAYNGAWKGVVLS